MTYRCLVLGDIHCGSVVAPWPTGVSFPDGGAYKPSKYQRWLNKCWDHLLEDVKGQSIDSVVVMGDALDGDNPRSSLVTDRADCQIAAAVELLTPIREQTDNFYMIAGTTYHVGKGAQYETSIARELDAVVHPETKHPVWPFLLKDLGGVVTHFAHHIGTVRNNRYEPAALWGALINITSEYAYAYGRIAPRIECIVRAHRHRMIHVEKGHLNAVAVCGWQLHTDFSLKVAGESVPEIGYAWLEVDDKLRVRQVSFRQPLPHVE